MNCITEGIALRANKRDEDILKFIKSYMVENGYAPTIREIGDAIGMRSPSSVHKHFEKLVAKGEIIQHPDGKRYRVKGMRFTEG